MPLGVVTGRHKFDDLCEMAVGPEIAGNGHKHIRTVARCGKHLLINRERLCGPVEQRRSTPSNIEHLDASRLFSEP